MQEAERRAAEEQRREAERRAQLAREQEAFSRAGAAGAKHGLAFLYSQPRVQNTLPSKSLHTADDDLQAKSNELRARKKAGDAWCARCNVRGHTANDADCPLANADPSNPFQQRLDDPHKMIELRKRQLLQEGNIDTAGVLSVTFQPQIDPNDPNNQLLEMSDEPADDLHVEKEFLQALSESDRELLIKHFMKEEGDEDDKKKHKKAKKKEKKKEKKKKGSEKETKSKKKKTKKREREDEG